MPQGGFHKMVTSTLGYFIFLVFLLACSAFFSGAETALFSLSRSQIARFRKRKTETSKHLIQFLSEPKSTLVTILFGNETVNVAFSVLIANLVYLFFGGEHVEEATFVAVFIGTLLLLIFGEILPKNIAIIHAETFAPVVAIILLPLHTFTRPFRAVIVRFAEMLTHLFGANLQKEPPMIVEEEFRHLLELGTKTGEIDKEESELIHKALEFENKRAQEIMTPITIAFRLDVNLAFNKLLEAIKATQFSRIPMYETHRENIIGYLYVKDLLQYDLAHQKNPDLSLYSILRKPIFIDQHSKLEDILQAFRDNRIHMAILTDSNKPVGLITMHDVIEALFGEVEE